MDNETTTFPLTTFELATLLSLVEGAAAAQSAASLRLPDPRDAISRRAGLSSLVVRGLVDLGHGRITPQGKAGAVAGVLTTADQWVEIGVARRDTADAAVLVGAGQDVLLLSPRGFDVWDVLPVDGSKDLVDAGIELARQGVEVTGADEPVAVSVKVTRATGSAVASAHRDAQGGWQVAIEPADPDGRLTILDDAPADQAEALATLRKALP